MSDHLLEEYRAYYAARAERYADNPNYKNTYEAEKNLSDAMQSCATLEDFKTKIGDLNEKCAIALVKDEYLMEKAHFEKHQETVRVLACNRILEKVDSCKNAMDIVTLVTEETNKNSIEISMDESHRGFQSDWKQTDELRIYQNAEVPDQYKEHMMNSVQEFKDAITRDIVFTEQNNHEWEAGWKIKPELNTEYRHRRLIPYKDEHVNEQISFYKSITNR